MITVFTPTFNRAYILKRLYDSLCCQTNHSFEWVIVDDGSADNTQELVDSFIFSENSFQIRYLKTENYGKHHAINKGVELAKGTLFFIVDSDDWLTPNAIERIYEIEAGIIDKKGFAGICGQKGGNNGPLGHSFQGEILDCTYLDSKKQGIWGDKAEVYYTEVLKKYPFPVFKDEKFIPESVVWDRIAHDGFKLRYFNDVIYLCEYFEDGLTANLALNNSRYPKGRGLYLAQSISFGKIRRLEKWQKYNDYFNQFNKQYGLFSVAKNLHVNPVKFYLMLLGYRLFLKIYNR